MKSHDWPENIFSGGLSEVVPKLSMSAMRNCPQAFLSIILAWLFIALGFGVVEAKSLLDEKTLQQNTDQCWFDTKLGQWRFPTVEATQKLDSTDFLADRDKYSMKATASRSFFDWNDLLQQISDTLAYFFKGFKWVVVLLALIVLGVCLYAAIAYARDNLFETRGRSIGKQPLARALAKIEDLPFDITEPQTHLLAHAEAFRQAGNYSQAIIYLFGHVLVQLDANHLIHIQRGKTNRAYLREIQSEPELCKYHQYFMQIFEAVFFGRYPINQAQCDDYWEVLPSFERAIQAAKQNRLSEVSEPSRQPPVATRSVARLGGWLWLSLGLFISIVGCGQKIAPVEHYAESESRRDRNSLGAFGLFKALCQKQGLKVFHPKSLSPRTASLDVIIWSPRDFHIPNEREVQWFNDWLQNGYQRTLVFVGRDYSPSSFYWSEASRLASPEERMTYRQRQAAAECELEALRVQGNDPAKKVWFQASENRSRTKRVERTRGLWSESLESGRFHLVSGSRLDPIYEAWIHEPVALSNGMNFRSSQNTVVSNDTSQRYGVPEVEHLIVDDMGDSLVWRMSYKHWSDSRLIVFSNASLLANEGLVQPGNQALVEKLFEPYFPGGRVGFLASTHDCYIRSDGHDDPKGFELLRVWPLSLISMHGLFVGFIALLSLWPIFGRPQRLAIESTADFGKHIEALGELLHHTHDRDYALQRINDYFREVRRETRSPWATVSTAGTKSSQESAKNNPSPEAPPAQ